MVQSVFTPTHERRLQALEKMVREALVGVSPSGLGLTYTPDGRMVLPGGALVGAGGLTAGSPPPAPSGLVLTPGADAGDVYVDVNWTPGAMTAAGPITAWAVEVLRDGDTLPSVLHPTADLAPPNQAYRVHYLDPNTLYHFAVRAITQLGASSTTLTGDATTGYDTAAPAQVTGLAAAAGLKTITAEWTALGSTLAPFKGKYLVDIATNNTFTTGLRTFDNADSNVITIGDLVTLQNYYLRVTARSASGVNATVSATVGPVAPGVVANGDISAGTIGADRLVAGSVTATQMHADSITAANAALANATVTNAKIVDCAVDKLTAGSIAAILIQLSLGGIIRSSNYVAGTSGWQIDGAGNAELNNVTIRGILAAASLASSDFTFYDSGGQRMLRLLHSGSSHWLQLGDGIGVGAGLRWDATLARYIFEGGTANSPAFTFASAVNVGGSLFADGSIAVGGTPYSGGVFANNGAGALDQSWGLAFDSNIGAGIFSTELRYWADTVTNRRAGIFDNHLFGWIFYGDTNGDCYSRTSWSVFSSKTLKKNIKTLAAVDTDPIMALRPVRYRLKAGDDNRTTDRFGLIGEEVAVAMPELANRTGDLVAVDYTSLVVPLLAKVQDQEKRLTALEGKAK